MFISRLELEHFGSVDFFQAAFHSRIVALSGGESGTVAQAIRLLTGSRSASPPLRLVQSDCRLSAQVEMERPYIVEATDPLWNFTAVDAGSGKLCTQDYQKYVNCCTEEEAVACFSACQQADFPHRLCRYIQAEREKEVDFSKSTDGMGFTNTFRSYLKTYIRHFEPQLLYSGIPYRLTLSTKGEFVVLDEDRHRIDCFSEAENRLFHFQCFLNLVEFWDGFEAVRDMHHAKRPLIISHLLEFLPQDTDMTEIRKRINALGRQMFICTPLPCPIPRGIPDMQTITI